MALNLDFNIRRTDTLPSVSGTLLDPDGNPVNLTGASAEFIWRLSTDAKSAAVSGSAVVVDTTNGVVRFDWSSGETDVAGIYLGEFEVTFSDSNQLTVPTTGSLRFRIHDDVN